MFLPAASLLASHSQIDGTLELPNILALAHRLRGRRAGQSRYPEVLHDLTAEQFSAFGAKFIEDTRVHRQGAPFFIDKMPNNFRHIGLIHLILPNAKIIDARRAPMDCCFSGFKQLFAEGQEFTYGLPEIGRYYADYVELMDHWDAVLPGKVLRVQHEDDDAPCCFCWAGGEGDGACAPVSQCDRMRDRGYKCKGEGSGGCDGCRGYDDVYDDFHRTQ